MVTVISAKYGSLTKKVDVTPKVQALFNSSKTIYAINELFGDPAPNELKFLEINIEYGDKEQTTETIRVNEWDSISTIPYQINLKKLNNITTNSSSVADTNNYSKIVTSIISLYIISIEDQYISTGTGFCVKLNDKIYCLTAVHNFLKDRRDKYYNNIIGSYADAEGNIVTSELQVKSWASYPDFGLLEFKTNSPTTYLDFATSVTIGEKVFAFGNPMGIEVNSVSEGIVRDSTYYIGNDITSVCHTCTVLKGNSGGPLLNIKGEVVAMINAGIQDYETFTWGTHYKILQKGVDVLKDISGPYIGKYLRCNLQIHGVLEAMMLLGRIPKYLNGFIVHSSDHNILQTGDIILKINGMDVNYNKSDHFNELYFNTNSTVELLVERANGTKTITAQLYLFDYGKDRPLGTYNSELQRQQKKIKIEKSRVPIANKFIFKK